jgi:hypothetical protein
MKSTFTKEEQKMSRKTVLEERGITRRQMVKTYREEESLLRAADILGINEKTLRKYLDEAGIIRKQGPRAARSREVPEWHHSCLAEFIKANPKVKLPRKYKDIVELTGCTLAEVKSYLYRKRKYVKDGMHRLPQPEMLNITLIDTEGIRIPTRAIWKSYYTYHKRSFLITSHAEIRGSGKIRKFTHTLEEWRNLYGINNES